MAHSNDEPATFPEPGTLRLQRVLPGPIERVWAYLTEPEKRAKWFAGGPMELRVGGKADLLFHHPNLTDEPTPTNYKDHCENVVSHQRVTQCDPPRLLAYTFGEAGPQGQPEVTFELNERGDKVVLTITHRRTGSREDTVGYASGWHIHTDLLEDILNGVPRRPFWAAHARREKEYQARAAAI